MADLHAHEVEEGSSAEMVVHPPQLRGHGLDGVHVLGLDPAPGQAAHVGDGSGDEPLQRRPGQRPAGQVYEHATIH